MAFTQGNNLLIQVVDAVDSNGQPTTTFPAPIVWTTSDATILPVTASTDGLSATGTLLQDGSVTVTATSGAISASTVINGVAGQAVSFQLAVSLAPTPVAPPVTPVPTV